MTRVTQRLLSQSTLANLQGSLARTARLQERLSTGRVLNRPSDSPTGLVTAMQTRSTLARQSSQLRAADNATSWLTTADSALQGASSLLRRVRELTVQGANDTTSPVGRENIAREVDALRAGLIEVANSSFNGRHLFAGTADSAGAFDATGTYLGDAAAVNRTLSDGQQVAVNLPGDTVFGSGPTSIFAVLDDISTALRTPGAPVGGANLDALDAGVDRILTGLGELGARQNLVDGIRERGVVKETTLQQRLSEAESTDLTETVMELQLQEVAYQSALAATARVLQPSLLDFLR